MAVQWYVRRGTEQSGPISRQEFEMLRGHLQETDLLRRSDWPEWKPFKSALHLDDDATLVPREADGTPRTLLSALLERDMRGRGIAPGNRRQYQYARVVEELAQSVMDEIGSHPHWDETLRARYRQIVSMVEEFIRACHADSWQREPPPDARDRLTVLWRHRDMNRELKTAGARTHLDKEAISDIAYDYLRRDARSREFEYLLVDALAAAEIYSLDAEIKKSPQVEPQGRSFLARFFWHRDTGKTLAIARGLLAKMIAAYGTLSTDNPSDCRQVFERAAEEGAGWDPLVLRMLEALGVATEVESKPHRTSPGDLGELLGVVRER